LQQQYDAALEKKEVQGWVKGVLKDKTKSKERVRKGLKEKEKYEHIA
jgi:hypothetical protein